MVGKQSLIFEKKPYLIGSASVVGSKEAEGPMDSSLTRLDMMINLAQITGKAPRGIYRVRR